jgi:hypothetical protein
MRSWRNDAVLIVGSFLLGAIFITICFGWWPDTGDENGIPIHPFWRFLWQWQTLIAGALALGGAAWTVSVIRAQIDQAEEAAKTARRVAIAGQNRPLIVEVETFRADVERWVREFTFADEDRVPHLDAADHLSMELTTVDAIGAPTLT